MRADCPTCGQKISRDNSFLPFCCERCRLLDLGQWLDGNYRVPGQKISNLKQKRRNELDRLIHAFVTGLGAGYLPLAPGTWGSLVALLLVFLLHWVLPAHETMVLGGFVVLLTFPAIVLSTRVSLSENDPDPSKIVIDEILGQVLCLLWVPVSMVSLVAGFFLFRFFDIVKPFPVRNSEKLPGGVGIVCDDLIAGLYAGLSLKILVSLSG